MGLKGFNIHTRRPLQVELTLPALQQLTMQGSGDADVKGFNGEQLQLALRGSGNAVVVGQYKRINASILGSGDLQLNGGNSDHVELSLTGSGEMTITGQSKALAAKKSWVPEISTPAGCHPTASSSTCSVPATPVSTPSRAST
ncbi:GIN domain-containing protein [Undibacterium arcticum]